MTKAVLSKMSDVKSGAIVNIGSISSERAIPRVSFGRVFFYKGCNFDVHKINCCRICKTKHQM